MSRCYQTSLALWLHLPHRLLSPTTVNNVAGWKEHAVADFQEMMALYFSPPVLDLYMNVFSNHFLLYMKTDAANPRCCKLRENGLLCCDRYENSTYPGFCSYGHQEASGNPLK